MTFTKLNPLKIRDIAKGNKELWIVLRRVLIADDKDCWFLNEDWSIYRAINGQPAHRFMYEKLVGPIEEGNLVCHKCDRPGCINPKHLYQGNNSDNQKDRRVKEKLRKLQRRRMAKKAADEHMRKIWERPILIDRIKEPEKI